MDLPLGSLLFLLQKIKNVTGVNSSRQKTLAIMKQNKTSVRQVSKLRDLTVSHCNRFMLSLVSTAQDKKMLSALKEKTAPLYKQKKKLPEMSRSKQTDTFNVYS